jgi:hypothetical protein
MERNSIIYEPIRRKKITSLRRIILKKVSRISGIFLQKNKTYLGRIKIDETYPWFFS